MKTWLGEQGFETPFLDYDKHAGIPPGADWEKTLYREIERSEAIVIVQTPNWLESKWCFAEFTQARALGKPIFPVMEAPTGDTLISPDIQTLNLLTDREGGLEQLATQLTQIALDAQGGFAWDTDRSPYPGLLAFQEEDAALFFGRDDDIRRLIERLNARRAQGGAKLIALLGASGSGKSSLLRAGVIPRLKRAGRNWVVLPPMRPQVRPVNELARSLAVALGSDWRELRDQLSGANLADALSDIAGDLLVKAGATEANILLPIDQAEELFGAADPDQARRFFEILNVILSPDQPYIGVMAIRSDYLGSLQSADGLTARFEEFSLGPMPLVRIAQIIEGPARVAGLGIDEALVHEAARDAETEDALPLLAFALRELYDRSSDDNYLSLDEYKALGDEKAGLTPLENAVSQAADDVLIEAKPGDEELTALREAFVPDMVRVNDQGEYIRRPARWDELPAKSRPLLERLARARLLIVSQHGDSRMVEVAHEALLRKWPRLRSWLDDAREFLTGKQQLEVDLHEWQRVSEAQKTAALLTGLKLNRARGWLVDRPHQLSTEERAFIQAGVDHAEAKRNRKARLRRTITRASIAAALILAGVAVFAGIQWQEAREAVLFSSSMVALTLNAAVDPMRAEPEITSEQSNCQHVLRRGTTYGLMGSFCALRQVLGMQRLAALAGVPIFLSGPHGKNTIEEAVADDFGHYNPAFLDWVRERLVPDADDTEYIAQTQALYDEFAKYMARSFYLMHVHLAMHPALFQYERRIIEVQIDPDYIGPTTFLDNRGGPSLLDFYATGSFPEIIFDFTSLGINEESVTHLSTKSFNKELYDLRAPLRFWTRRSIDGTADEVFATLRKMVGTYDPEFARPYEQSGQADVMLPPLVRSAGKNTLPRLLDLPLRYRQPWGADGERMTEAF